MKNQIHNGKGSMRKARSGKLVLWMLIAVLARTVANAQAPANNQVPEDARRYFVQGNLLFKQAQSKNDYARAEALYEQAIGV